MSHFKIKLVSILLLFSFLSEAQIELKNQILDFSTLLPIESASIYVKNTTIGTVSNADGKFTLMVDKQFERDTLVVSSIGYKSYKIPVDEFVNSVEVYLEEDVASLDEIVLVAETRPKTGNDIVKRALRELDNNLPDSSYLQKGFLRHKERNSKEFKWLIESAITLYDSSYISKSKKHLKINVDEVRKSYDLRNVDSMFTYTSYLKAKERRYDLKPEDLNRRDVKTSQLIKAIKWNDTRVNGLESLLKGKLNLLRNINEKRALFGTEILNQHQFTLDTILVDDGRKIYKIKIGKSKDYVNLETKGIYNDGYQAEGWLYIYWDNYAIKKIEYQLNAASAAQKSRSKRLLGSTTNHKLTLAYKDYNGKMYPNYIYYETPKLVNVGLKYKGKVDEKELARYNKEERYYYTVQEILFSEIITDQEKIQSTLNQNWDPDIFSQKPYNKSFWDNYNTLLESEEDEKLIEDLTRRSSLYKY